MEFPETLSQSNLGHMISHQEGRLRHFSCLFTFITAEVVVKQDVCQNISYVSCGGFYVLDLTYLTSSRHMDPHSRFSQFNSRQTKAGPKPSPTRSMEQSLKTTNPLETYKKHPATQRRESSPSVHSLAVRPIATNSRIKQGACPSAQVVCRSHQPASPFPDEQYRKDMYLVFISNALQQKSKASPCHAASSCDFAQMRFSGYQ